MADSSLELQMRLKDDRVQTGLDALVRKEDDVAKSAQKIARSVKLADEGLTRFANRQKEITSTPLEKYGRQMDLLNEALKRGKLNKEEFAKAAGVAASKLHEQTEAADDTKQRMIDLAEAEKRSAAEAAKAAQLRVSWLQRVKSASAELEQQQKLEAVRSAKVQQDTAAAAANARLAWLGRVKTNSAQLEQQQRVADLQALKRQQELFGATALGQLTTFAAGYFTLQTAVNLVADAFRNARQESEEALGSLRSLDDARRELNQVSGSQEEYAGRMNRADAAAAKYGVTRQEAYGTLTQAINYGIEGDFEQIMAGRQVVRPGAAIEVGGRLASMFSGTGTMEAVNMALAAGRPSSMTFEQFASTMAIIGEGGMQQGAGAEESMSAVGVLSKRFQSGKVAADRIKNFLSKASMNEATQGKGLLGALDTMQGMSSEQRMEILGKDMESNAAYNALVAEESAIRALMTDVSAARTRGTELAAGIARADATPQDVAASLDASGKVRQEIDREKQLGVGEGARSAAASRQAAIANRQGMNFWQRGLAATFRGAATFVGGNDQVVAAAGLTGEAVGRNPGMLTSPRGGFDELFRLLTGQNQFAQETVAELKEIRRALQKAQPRANQAEARLPLQ